jgi:hypothetical protein
MPESASATGAQEKDVFVILLRVLGAGETSEDTEGGGVVSITTIQVVDQGLVFPALSRALSRQ